MNSSYEEARTAYWDAERVFREAAIAEMIRLMPVGVVTIRMEITDQIDNMRLSVTHMLDATGRDLMEDGEVDDVWSDLDQIAWDLQVHDWQEAKSFLDRDGDANFVVRRPEVTR